MYEDSKFHSFVHAFGSPGMVAARATSDGVRVIEVLALPRRRESPAMARSHYREVDAAGLDRKGQMTIAAWPLTAGMAPEDPEDTHLKEPQ
jgi:ribosome-associated heat shock protein Hsp15